MRVLFDQGTPAPLRTCLGSHDVATTFELGWSVLANGDLLAQAEASAFDVFVTTDQNLQYQQNLQGRRIAVIVLTTTSWPRIQKVAAVVSRAVDSAVTGGYVEIPIP
jgi:hypothetical protein